jgi:hypothetical protein
MLELSSVPDPGSGTFLTPRSGSWMEKILKFFDSDPVSRILSTLDGKNKKKQLNK